MISVEERRSKALCAISLLKEKYPEAVCSLESKNALELLIATRLSAQCTDARVNLVTPVLFERYKTLEDFCAADVADIEKIIHSCGFFRAKAKDIVGMCRKIKSDFGGEVPSEIEQLVSLPGVGRKTANLVAGDVFGKPAVVCDTHCIRICSLLGLSDSKDPLKVEKQLREVLPPMEGNDFCHRLVLFGREVCVARRPRCAGCELSGICEHFQSQKQG